MSNIRIFSDSSCDTPKVLLDQYEITLIPFYVSFDKEHYLKEIQEISIDTFYNKLTTEKIFPKTSLPSVQDYIDQFQPAIESGEDILCLCLTSAFSGSYQSSCTARDMLLEDHPDARIAIINSIQATAGQGITLLQAVYMRVAGYSLEQIEDRMIEIMPTSRIMFTLDTLEYLQKGGRIGKVASLAGTFLNLKPMIQLKEGELQPVGTVRGFNKSLDRVITMVREHFETIEESYDSYDFCLAYGTDLTSVAKVQVMLEELIGRKISYPLFRIGVTIGTNTGPGAIGICFIKKSIE